MDGLVQVQQCTSCRWVLVAWLLAVSRPVEVVVACATRDYADFITWVHSQWL
jgi:hypothetical protein